jgi:hypothetical protein
MENNMNDNEKQKQREAWRVYAAAALPISGDLCCEGYIDMARQIAIIADAMLAEENKRFGGNDEN